MFLDDIIFDKRQEVTALKVKLNIPKTKKILQKMPRPKNFLKAFPKGKISLIAEVKKASPSAGIIIAEFSPFDLAKEYQKSGAAAISVLTDEKYFHGRISDLEEVRKAVGIPILRKDFILDESQIYESRLAGADAILLIVRILSDEQLDNYLFLAHALKMKCLVEVHDEAELERALKTDAEIIGINNRDLDSFEVDFNTTLRLINKFPEVKKRVVISESGIHSAEQVKALKNCGVSGLLVGESLLRSENIKGKIRELTA